MNTGKVKYFNDIKGFGFIIDDASKTEYFVHATGINGGTLKEGDNVEFDLAEGKKGMNAVNVSII